MAPPDPAPLDPPARPGAPPVRGAWAAYEGLRRPLFRELARLGRSGVVVRPLEGVDLVHGYLADVWPAVLRAYRPDRGPLEPYAVAAFRNYVLRERRRAAQRERRLRELEAAPAPAGGSASRHDLGLVARAVGRLPGPEREALAAFMAAPSVRATARALGCSRPRAEDLLGRAVARVAVDVGPPAGVEPGAWGVVRLALAEGATLRGVAARTGRPYADVEAAYRDVLGTLVASLRRQLSPHDPPGPMPTSDPMPTPEPVRTPAEEAPPAAPDAGASDAGASGVDARALVVRFVEAPHDPAARDALRRHAAAVAEWVRTDPGADAVSFEGVPPEAVVAFYEALAEGAPSADDEPDADRALVDQRVLLGELVATQLVPAHPRGIDGLRDRVGGLEERGHREELLAEPDVAAAGAAGAVLAERGLRPAHVARVAKACGLVLDRAVRRGVLPAGAPVRVSADGDLVDVEGPDRGALVSQSAKLASVREDAARALVGWLVDVSEWVPSVIPGYEATPEAGGVVRLTPAGVRSPEALRVTSCWQVRAVAGP